MKARNRKRSLGGLTLVAGLVAAAVLPVACGGGDKKGSGSGNGGNGNAGSGNGGGGNGTGGIVIITNGGTSGDSGSNNTGGTCGESALQAGAKPVNILLVVDRSLSMTGTPTGFTTDKWTAMKSALVSAVTATQTSINYGLELFPYPATGSTPADDCEVALPGIQVPIASGGDAGAATVSAITAALNVAAKGNTPTAAALDAALTYYTTGAGAGLTGDKFVLLATDGGPNCNSTLSCGGDTCVYNLDDPNRTPCTANVTDGAAYNNCCDPFYGGASISNLGCLDDAATTQKIQALLTAGVKTIVVGIPGSEVYSPYLDQFALAGGAPASATTSPNYYRVDAAGGTQGLTTTLQNITKQLVTSCRQQIQNFNGTTSDLSKITVKVDFGTDAGLQEVPRLATNSTLTDGWILDTTTNPPTVELVGSYCTQVQTYGAQSVQVILGCQDIIPK